MIDTSSVVTLPIASVHCFLPMEIHFAFTHICIAVYPSIDNIRYGYIVQITNTCIYISSFLVNTVYMCIMIRAYSMFYLHTVSSFKVDTYQRSNNLEKVFTSVI